MRRRGQVALWLLTGALIVPGVAHAASANLLVNPGAELGANSRYGLSAVTIPGWLPTGDPTVAPYGAPAPPATEDDQFLPLGFPAASQGPQSGGVQFFGGGIAGSSTLSQTVNLAPTAAAIDRGGVRYTLSGSLGGYSANLSDASVSVTFRDAGGLALPGSGAIGPVTVLDRLAQTGLLQRSHSGPVPAGARSAEVLVTFTDLSLATTLVHTEASAYDTSYADNLSFTLSVPMPAPPPPAPPPSRVGRLDHVFMVFMENEGDAQIVGNHAAPYLNGLIAANGFATNDHGLSHPSDENYTATLAGSDYGVIADCTLSCVQNVKSLPDEVQAAGESWAMYNQSMPTPCDKVSTNTRQGNYYDNDDTPWIYFADIEGDAARCDSHVLPLPDMTTALQTSATTPNYVWFSANDCNDMEGCGIAPGDTWLSRTIPLIESSPAWRTQRTAIFITWDEDGDSGGDNRVPMIVLASPHSGMLHGAVRDGTYFDHYSLTRTIELALGLAPMTANDRFAAPLNGFWPAIPSLSDPILSPSVTATLSYQDSAAAQTTFVLLRERRRRQPVVVERFTHADVPGTNRVRIPGAVRRHRLPPGPYLLLATPRNTAQLAGSRLRVHFQVPAG